jgi:carboxyl-terminal processing protease
MLEARHEKRVAGDKEWLALQADIADARALRKDTSISLNEQTRRAERDEQDAKHKERHPDQVADGSSTDGAPKDRQGGSVRATPSDVTQPVKRVDIETQNPVATIAQANAAKPAPTKHAGNPGDQDDGLQADERSLKAELAEEKKRKAEKDVVLNEASCILADEVELLHSDTKLAARVLPHSALGKNAVD